MNTKNIGYYLVAGAMISPGLLIAQQEVIEEIVVTGSLIRGTPEDTSLPVEVHTIEDMQLSGAPTALEFAKSLTSSGPTTGEAHYFGGAANTGNVQYNLRGIGSDKTLSLFNGRRITQNTSVIPSIALQRVEVLKDGAAVTYGANATGGVVNFISRDNFEGIEMAASYKGIDGSDGDWTTEIMGGFGSDDTNILWAAEWNHRSELDTREQDFSSLPYAVNPAPWSTLTNLATWVAHATLPADYSDNTPTSGFTSGDEFGTVLGAVTDFSQTSCEDVGGVFAPTATGGRSCNYGYLPYYNLVEQNEIYRLFGQITSSVSDTMEFYGRIAYANVYTPYHYGSPAQPVVRGPAVREGLVSQFYVPRGTATNPNPYWDEFANRSGLVNITHPVSGVPLYSLVQGASAATFRAFAHGGNDAFAHDSSHSTPSEIERKYWHLSTGLNGEFDNGVVYDFAITYNYTDAYTDSPDIIAYRLQEALNGFGGPDCDTTGLDQNPDRFGTQNPAAAGQNGCQWFNPFATNFLGQPVLGLANPSYGGTAFENDPDLIRWLFDDRVTESVTNTLTVDYVLSGDLPVELTGGAIAWGAGVQWRTTNFRETVQSDFYNGNQPCVWPNEYGQIPASPTLPGGAPNPDYNGCTPDEPGPFQFFGTNPPNGTRQDQKSAFVEFNLPVLDTLYFTAASRYEEFSGGLSATVYKVSGKWQATDNFALRGSYGTNYQAPAANIVPGNVARNVNSYTVNGGQWLGATTITRSDIEPETATVASFGVIWQSQGFRDDSDFEIIIDYFDIETEDELGFLASANDIADSVFSIDNGTLPNLADCTHPLIERVEFNVECTQGVTTANDFANITTDFGNGPGQLTQGYDIQMNYSFPFLQGDLRFVLTATRITKLENTPTELDGFQLDSGDDRLGYLNFETIAFAASEWRANFGANYAQDIHNFRAVVNFVSGVDDERYLNADGSINTATITPVGFQTGTLTPLGPSDFGVKGEDWISLDLHYSVDMEFATVTASVANITDQDPPESRQEFGYDPLIGDPLGRTFEVGIRKEF